VKNHRYAVQIEEPSGKSSIQRVNCRDMRELFVEEFDEEPFQPTTTRTQTSAARGNSSAELDFGSSDRSLGALACQLHQTLFFPPALFTHSATHTSQQPIHPAAGRPAAFAQSVAALLIPADLNSASTDLTWFLPAWFRHERRERR
jgi:hypothetical protein